MELQKQRDKYRLLPHNIPSNENWITFRNARNKLKKKIKDTITAFHKKILTLENSKEIWKIVHRILKPSDKTLEADTNELNKCFNQTGKRLTRTEPHSNAELVENHIGSYQLQTVLYEDVEQCLRPLRNDCSTGYDNILTMFIKPAVEFLVSPLIFVINSDITTNNFPDAWKITRTSPIPKIVQPVEL